MSSTRPPLTATEWCTWCCLLLLATLAAGCSGGGSGSVEVDATSAVAQAPASLSVASSVATLTLHPGDQSVPLQVQLGVSAYGGPITVTVSGLPSGISVTALTLPAGGSGTLYLSASLAADQEAFPADVIATTSAQSSTVQIVAVAGAMQAVAPLTLTVAIENPAYAPAASAIDLPVVRIDTQGTPIVDKTTDVPGTITITSADGATSYLPNASDSDNSAKFHVHGNSTADMPKKPYHVKLGTSLDLLGAMGLSCPYVTGSGKPTCDKSKTYILLANYDDKTLLRDWAASALANAIPMGGPYLQSVSGSPTPSGGSSLMPWAPHSLFVELYVNGSYEGNYQLIEAITVDSHRVNIAELAEADLSGDLSGGYLMEIDSRQTEAYVWRTAVGVPVGLIDPDFSPDPEVPAQTSYISAYVDAAEAALFSADFTDPVQGWRAYFDEAAAVNYYIVNDVLGNVDGGDFTASVYLYKNKDQPLLYMGPIWDFDISSGNVNYAAVVDATVPWAQNGPWYAQWFGDLAFKASVAAQWNALKSHGVLAAWLSSITQQAGTLQRSQANNFNRWPVQGLMVWPNAEAAGSYAGEVAYLTNWLQLRMAYLDSQFNAKAPTSTALVPPPGTLRAGSSWPLSAQVAVAAGASGTVYFLANGVIVGSATLDGSGQARTTTSALPAGNVALKAVYSGDDGNALSASAEAALVIAPPPVATAVGIASTVLNASQVANVTLSASVIATSGSALPTGTVTFETDGIQLGTVALSAGLATLTLANLPAGSGTVQAVYGGDSGFQASASPLVALTASP